METIIKVGGMTCRHCAMHVKQALLEVTDVLNVEVNLMEQKAIVTSKNALNEKEISQAILDAGYEFKGIIK